MLLRIGMISDEEVLTPSLNREGWGGSPAGVGLLLGGLFPWHPCGTRDTLLKRVPAQCLWAMWHPCTLNSKNNYIANKKQSAFTSEGGIRERMTAVRLDQRETQRQIIERQAKAIETLQEEIIRLKARLRAAGIED